MASITSLSNSNYNTSSIYGNRNVLSGLASGMDTETMIENAVSGIKMKIQNLQKRRTKIEWQQEAYRSIIDKAANFNTKYTSYSSKTNLMSASFFNNAVNTAVSGTYKDKITASGRTSSDIKINAVKQLATAATYTVSGLGGKFNGEIVGIEAASGLNLGEIIPVSNISGTLSIQYGSGTRGATFDLKFDELEDIVKGGPDFAEAINKKLSEITYSYTKNGFQETTTADKAVKAVYKNGEISFQDVLGTGNKVIVGGVSGDMEETLGISAGDTTIGMTYDTGWVKYPTTAEYLEGKELGVTFNGTTKKISMDDVLKNAAKDTDGNVTNDAFVKSLNTQLGKAFGEGKISAKLEPIDPENPDSGSRLSLTPKGAGDTLALGGTAMKALGFTEDNTNYINTGKKLSELMGEDFFEKAEKVEADGDVKTSADGKYSVDSKGNRVAKAGDDNKYYRVNSDGEFLYNFTINDANINVTKDTTLESLMNSINSSAEAGVKVSYSKLTNEFKFTATETGSQGKIEFGGLAKEMFGTVDTKPSLSGDTQIKDIFTKYSADNFGEGAFAIKLEDGTELKANVYWGGDGKGTTLDGIAKQLSKDGITATYNDRTNSFDLAKDGEKISYTYEKDSMADRLAGTIGRSGGRGDYVAGQDAVMDVEINGKRFEDLTRSSNSFDIDGLTVNVKGEFTTGVDKDGKAEEAITFKTSTDSDKIVDAIREFVNDYNEMATELKNAYSTMPAQKSNGARYEPLTAEEEDKYSESELKAYNEKAKQGILFGDSTLSSMYGKLLSAITPGGADGQALREIGIGTSYSNGMTTLSLDESKLRAALDSDPDKVKNAFTKTKEGGSASDGLMKTMQNTLNTYVKTTGEPKGVLIQRAGSAKAYTSLNNNSLKSQMDNIDKQIDRWTDKMSKQIDRYTTQFSRLEQLIAQMNSQASAMSGLMGGSGGY